MDLDTKEQEETYDSKVDDASIPPSPHHHPPRPKGFAQRLMAKYGWTKGTGLGAQSTGITTALRVQVEKRRRKPDAEGGGMSVVVVLDRMLDDMPDVEAEVEAGLGQEIGEECGERYGRVERIVVDVEGGRVFIRFVEGVSALRAVNALEGRIFNGNTITARFYDEEKFEDGIYDG
ncbi:hypothetical protein N0V88_002534 [Collariella sp. IMI 366227]|nr:hypothetical protein N0V88_002534 [Collariella sp. IMI 366227]